MQSLKSLILYIFVFLLCAALFQQCEKKEDSTSATGNNTADIAFTVRTAAACNGNISEYLTYSGMVKSAATQVIIPEVPGRITRLYKDAGDTVQKGDLLLELENTVSRAQNEQADAALASAKLAYADAEKNWLRYKNLFAKNTVTLTQLEQAETIYKTAANNLQQAQALYDTAAFQYRSAKVYAPFTGIITARNKEIGDYINPSIGGMGAQAGVYILENYTNIHVDADVPNADIERIEKGQRVDIINNKYTLPGQIACVNEKADPLSLNVPVRITATNAAGRILPATVVTIRIHFRKKADTIIVPAAALVEDNRIFVVAANRVQERKVTVGLQNPEMAEILTGIENGEHVVVEGNFGLYHNALVREEGK